MDNLFRCTQREKLHYYQTDNGSKAAENPWLLLPFANQWVNMIDIRKVKAQVEYLNPYVHLEFGGSIQSHLKNYRNPYTKKH
jgi:hypothetical protein